MLNLWPLDTWVKYAKHILFSFFPPVSKTLFGLKESEKRKEMKKS